MSTDLMPHSPKLPEAVSVPDATLAEIRDELLDKGDLSKADIIEGWCLSEAQYADVQRRLLASDNSIRKGPRKVGGFVVRKPSGRRPDSADANPRELEPRTKWEEQAASRLVSCLSKAKLEELLGKLFHSVRQIRRHDTGSDRHPTSLDLAAVLVLRHHTDLFREQKIREAVAESCGVQAPKRWRPGGPAAIEFVAKTEFPSELAGQPAPQAEEDYEYLEARWHPAPLTEFQLEVKTKLDQTLRGDGKRGILTLPTGAGKTRVCVESIRDWLGARYDPGSRIANQAAVLWLAHTEELCDQAYACFKQVWEASTQVCPLLLVRFWGQYTHDLARHERVLRRLLSSPSVLISTPQRVMNLLEGEIQGSQAVVEDLKRALGVLVVDEAHRAAAPSYREILNRLAPLKGEVCAIGLTATPFRMEYLEDPHEGTRELKELFEKLIEPTDTLGRDPRHRLVQMEVLAQVQWRDLKTPTTIRIPKDQSKAADYVAASEEGLDSLMRKRADASKRRFTILEEVVPLAQEPGNSILYFGPSVLDAEIMTILLRRRGIAAACVSGQTRDVTRRQIVNEFKAGQIRVLCNCEVLTTGFDAPRVTHIVVARPTVSQVLYEQMVGRGLRGPKFGGTQTCVILDCVDNFSEGRPRLGYEAFREAWRSHGPA